MRYMLLLFHIFITLLAVPCAQCADLIAAGDFNYPPYEYLDEDGEAAGFNVDLFREVAHVMGLDAEIRLGPWSEVRTQIETGSVDMLMGMFVTEERHRVFDFSAPHLAVHHSIFVRNDSNITSIDDIIDRSVIVQRGDIMHDYVLERNISSDIVTVETPSEGLRLLASGKHDCFLGNSLQGMMILEQFDLVNLVMRGEPFYSHQYCFAVREGNQHLLHILNEGLAILKQSGKYEEIYHTWFGVLDPSPISAHTVMLYVMPLGLVVFLLFIWSWQLKRQVKQRTRTLRHELHEREKAEEALRSTESMYRNMIEGAQEAIYRMKLPERTYEYVSPAAEAVLGYPREVLLENRIGIDDIIHSDSRTDMEHYWRTIWAGMVEPVNEFKIIDAQGNESWIMQSTRGIYNNEGRLTAIEGICRNITERKNDQLELMKSEEQLNFLVKNVPDIIYRLDGIGRIMFMGESIRRYGYNPDQLINRPVTDIIHPDDHPQVYERLELAAVDRVVFQAFELRIMWGQNIPGNSRNGKLLFLISAENIYDRSGTFIGMIGVARDITEQKKLEVHLIQAQKMDTVGRLAGGIAHDFNNLLTVISGNAELAIMDLDSAHPAFNDINEIKRTAERAAGLTRKLLAFSRQQVVEPKVIDLDQVLNDMVSMLHRLIGEQTDLTIQNTRNLWPVRIDPGQVEQVVINLVVNARDAMPDGGTINIRTANAKLDKEYASHREGLKPGDFVMLEVSDKGEGMTDEVQAHLFEPFFTTKEKHKGTGLGLSTCHGIIHQNRGDIHITSTRGHGTTVRIHLPRTGAPLYAAVATSDRTPNPTGHETILVVEDEAPVRSMIARSLTQHGHNIIEAEDGIRALDILREGSESISLVITDTIMPRMGGRELSGRLRVSHPELPILFISGYADTANAPSMPARSAFLQKPFDPHTLVRAVRSLLNL